MDFTFVAFLLQQTGYGLNNYGGATLTHHALQFSIQGGPNFVVTQAGRSMHRADLDLDPSLYHSASAPLHHPEGIRPLSGSMAHASLVDNGPVDLSTVAGHKMGLGHKENQRQLYGVNDMMGHHYHHRSGGVTVGIPDQSHGKFLSCMYL